ncbi:carbon starvation protein A [Romboutsia sp.]|uniref:carbon starvation CstA family protein n=1 Tax=Romboutsia sp. TaxID=1965302 RepID=UPI002B87DFFA|nr:carbon starvation protein A [Romboutsia sp.]HSQ88073.1 carbon starvation protein A [Romboutsia sp.]
MMTFLGCLAFLVGGYFIYGSIVEKSVKLDDSKATPATRLQDGVDFVPMPWHKVFLIQFLNIAGVGPIFGAVSGALFGPVAFLWITFGTIFAGGVHDFLSGVISMRHDGSSISEIVGIYLGDKMKVMMRIFSVVLLVLTGTVFVTSPAGLLAAMTGKTILFWTVIIIVYYIIATILPVDKVIGKIYPLFGAALLTMAFGLAGALIIGQINGTMTMAELTLDNLHPGGLSVFPFLFTTIACGALSGFHSTQSPMMARCINRESEAKRVFYGAMVAEGVIALVWCAVAIAFFGGTEGLSGGLVEFGGPSGVVTHISKSLLGQVGAILAILGVVACPITSGDTAFRSARLTIADAFNIKQEGLKNRFILAIPLFAVCIGLTFIDFNVIWRYFAWSNQTLATIFLWTGTVYLLKNKANYWITLIPATFMSAVCTAYILQAKEGFKLDAIFSNSVGIVVATILFIVFMINKSKVQENKKSTSIV